MTFPKGTFATTIFLALPLVLWCLAQPPTLTAYTLGQLLGVFGFTAFLPTGIFTYYATMTDIPEPGDCLVVKVGVMKH